jgi:hypothetical protein
MDFEVYADVARRMLRKEQDRQLAGGTLGADPVD